MSLANQNRARRWFRAGCLWGLSAVAIGAFGAHALAPGMSEKQLAWFHTGVDYQQFHTFAVLLCALALHSGATTQRAALAAGLFSAGIVFFSGSLYYMAITAQTGAAVLTPIGGVLFLAGWVVLALSLQPRHDAAQEQQ
ncbi:DUF423 domain-containing protein [Granulosicoccaceae sp. 1_MG-2023]|nr:DUF423 domain-containing protein [Granulosicoccaceae sp. 1_MG-2023]